MRTCRLRGVPLQVFMTTDRFGKPSGRRAQGKLFEINAAIPNGPKKTQCRNVEILGAARFRLTVDCEIWTDTVNDETAGVFGTANPDYQTGPGVSDSFRCFSSPPHNSKLLSRTI